MASANVKYLSEIRQALVLELRVHVDQFINKPVMLIWQAGMDSLDIVVRNRITVHDQLYNHDMTPTYYVALRNEHVIDKQMKPYKENILLSQRPNGDKLM